VDVHVSDDAPAAAAAAAAWIARRLRGAARRRGQVSLALSGGSTAPPMLAALLGHPVPWDRVTVWQVDERVRPDGHPARNFGQLADLPCRVRAMPVTAANRRAAAARYAASLPDRFDVVHLGLGDDGHTASWPPGRPEIAASERPVELVDDFNGHDRMTLTRPVVNGARARLVLSTGASKRPMVERWLLRDDSLPISAVRRTGTVVFLDEPAAPRAVLEPDVRGRV
jgi:6-phosphogluconolactonase/glucosamine-6-phosphate isomerase/deaminase